MAETRTTRLSLPQWSAGTDAPSRADFNEAFSNLDINGAMYGEGAVATRPAAGKHGRFWFDPATGLSYDDGSAWYGIVLLTKDNKFTGIQSGLDESVAAATGTSGAITLPLGNGVRWFTLSPSNSMSSLALTSVPSGRAVQVILVVTYGSTVYALPLPSGGKWVNKVPEPQPNQRMIVSLVTLDAGSTWNCSTGVTVG
jgi:hypothetical protein